MKRPKTADLSPKQERLATLLAVGSNLRDAAREAGISERQAYRWLDDEVFNRQVNRHRSKLVDETLGRLAAIGVKAVEALEGGLSSDNDNVRVRAAIGILDQLVRIREHSELEQRLTELEGRVPGVKSQRPA
jgi:hypothetical protein